jgi:type VI secretion system protein ImpC
VAAAGPQMFGCKDFNYLAQTRDVTRVFDSTEYVKWKNFRESEDARYVALTLPRILLRSPYGIRPGTPVEFKYEEDTRGGQYLLWGNAAFAFGTCVANAFTRYGWCGAIRGLEGGGLVEGLPTWVVKDQDSENRRSVEVTINDRREKELSDAGFLPLVQAFHFDFPVFLSATSCARPRRYESDAANANSRLSCQLQYVLTASRFMHFLKVMARDHISSYVTRSDLERMFNLWIARYVCLDDQASPSIRAKLPLREARVDVEEDAGRPGKYRILMFVRPYFQLDELSVSLRLVGSIGSG